MVTFAYVIKLDLPYSEYWIPLVMGMGVGCMFLVVARTCFRKRVVPRAPLVKTTHQDYDPFVHGSPTDQRRAYRRAGNPVEVHYATPESMDAPRVGWVFDRSVGGVGLVTSEEFAEDTPLAVRPTNAPNIVPWVDVVVRTCRPTPEGFELGCKFVKTPPWSILLMFG